VFGGDCGAWGSTNTGLSFADLEGGDECVGRRKRGCCVDVEWSGGGGVLGGDGDALYLRV